MQDSFEIKQNTTLFDFHRVTVSLTFKNKKLRRVYYFIVIVGVIASLSEFADPKPNWVHAVGNLSIVMLVPLLFFIVGTLVLSAVIYLVKPELFKATFLFNHWGMHKKTRTKLN